MLERTPLFAESWNIAWRNRPVASLLEDRGTPFIILKNSFRYWAADPFIFNYNGELYIFAELYDYITRKGVIGYCKWNGVRFGRWKKVIEEDYHLSYPYIFERDGNATTIVNVATHAVQIILLLSGFNVIAVQSVYFIINLVQMVYLTWYVQKNYSWLDLRAEPDYASLKQSKYVIVHQVSGLIFNNTDVILLTAFCDLKVVSVYSLYSMIFSCVANAIDTICSSVEFVLGQTFNSDKKRFLQLQEVYETYYLGVSFAFFTIALLLFPSFIRLYTSGIKDINYVDPWLPYLFAALYVLMYARRTSSQIINFAGHFQQTQWRSILESVINLSVSVFLVTQIGIYGVLIGTIVALLYRTNDIIIYTNRKILNRFPWKTYRRWGINLAVMVLLVWWLKRYLSGMENYFMWVLNALWVSIVCLVAFFVIDSLFDRSSFYFVVGRIKRFVVSRRKLRE